MLSAQLVSLARELHVRAFCGVVCVLTALDARELDEMRERAHSGVDLALPKGTAFGEVAAELLAARATKHAVVRARLHEWLRYAMKTVNVTAEVCN